MLSLTKRKGIVGEIGVWNAISCNNRCYSFLVVAQDVPSEAEVGQGIQAESPHSSMGSTSNWQQNQI
ncbi:hypothetical protein RvY_19107 [Ramazzottius varieornatus]|uniref:Uncharacterized protein n=1 Tax=Ramazzottius varieornatus TaxID=947166 RepID=A0A1D1W8A5_RAMVA|nr:hypothetical protein RvY_19107 [Ramazzottius varieornatus]